MPGKPTVILRKAERCMAQGDWQQAEQLYQSVLSQDPGNPTAQRGLQQLRQQWAAQTPDALQAVINLYQQGQLDTALQQGQALLARDPQAVVLHNIVGVIQAGLGHRQAAIESFTRVTQLQPNWVDGHANLGNALQEAGRCDEALTCYATVVRLQPEHIQGHYQLATLYHRLERYDEAVATYRAIIARDSNQAQAHNEMGDSLQALKQQEAALTSYKAAVKAQPDYAPAHYNLSRFYYEQEDYQAALTHGRRAAALDPQYAVAYIVLGAVLQKLEQLPEAIASYEKAITLQADSFEAHSNLAAAYQKNEATKQAIAAYEKALALKPDYVDAHVQLGIMLEADKCYTDALMHYQAALKIQPDLALAYNNQSLILVELGRYDEALASYDKALELEPDNFRTRTNLATGLKKMGRYTDSLAVYDEVIESNPEFAGVHLNKAMGLLILGDFINGWREYEYRWEELGNARDFSQPQWRGESLNGKTILLHCEQGIGDTLQFCRYVKQVAELSERADKVVFEVPEKLQQLLTPLRAYAQFVVQGRPLPEFDVHCPLLSLPLAFATTIETIPSAPSYLNADPQLTATWEQRLGPRRQPRIGLAWRGNPKHTSDHHRSLPLATLLDGLPEGYEYISLHHQFNADDQPQLHRLRHFATELDGFTNTAALYDALDLIISVDTSLAHLGGALGKPTWVLLSFAPDFRWLLERRDSPWYPSIRLFRQPAAGDWSAVLAEVREALATEF